MKINPKDYDSAKVLYECADEYGGMTVSLYFNEDNLNYLREKFTIEDKQDLLDCIYECISTYMEL